MKKLRSSSSKSSILSILFINLLRTIFFASQTLQIIERDLVWRFWTFLEDQQLFQKGSPHKWQFFHLYLAFSLLNLKVVSQSVHLSLSLNWSGSSGLLILKIESVWLKTNVFPLTRMFTFAYPLTNASISLFPHKIDIWEIFVVKNVSLFWTTIQQQLEG